MFFLIRLFFTECGPKAKHFPFLTGPTGKPVSFLNDKQKLFPPMDPKPGVFSPHRLKPLLNAKRLEQGNAT